MDLGRCVETFNLLGDESRLRLCALLRDRELCVSDLVQVTGISQSRVSTHLGRLREAGIVRDRRRGAQSFYTLAHAALPEAVQGLLDESTLASDPTLEGDRKRLAELEEERRGGAAASLLDDLERYYSPGRTWRSLTAGLAALLELGDVLDVGSGDGAAAAMLAPACRSLTCVDVNARMVEAARDRLARFSHVRVDVADVHRLPHADESFDAVLVFHTLTYTERPLQAITECARVLRPRGKLVLLCLDEHQQPEVTAPYGERHQGFSKATLTTLLGKAGLEVQSAEIACRESRKPRLDVMLAVASKPATAPSPSPSHHA
ncbi:MAG TPA: metalloregulator ArsR/SmtB family transcription factor [Polyangiaceae bacterium]|nr:metalloregulator ArsR/SmtB family transcription factor [Polyangiaceae bacterium]